MLNTRYPIQAASKLTGLSIDTLRAWERRYQVVTPERGLRGRLYTEQDVARLHLLREVVDQGHAIGQVGRLGHRDLGLLLHPVGQSAPAVVSRGKSGFALSDTLQLVAGAIEQFDYARAELELSHVATLTQTRQLIHHVVLPLMRLVERQVCSGKFSIAQEHMTSAILRNLLGALMRTHTTRASNIKLLFATPPGELHELGILAGAMLAAGGGLGAVYLGPNLPAEEIISAAKRTSSQVVILGILAASEQVRDAVKKILRALQGGTELWLAGSQAAEVARGLRSRRFAVIGNFEEFEVYLERLGAKL